MRTHAAIGHAAENLDAVLSRSRLLTDNDPGIGGHLTCREADAFADLLRAVGLAGHADDLIAQHAASDEPGDKHAE